MGFRVLKRGNIFYVRVWVPLDVRGVIKRTELKKSLHTGKRSEARVLATGLQNKAETAFMRIRTGMLSDRELERLAAELISEFTGRLEQHKLQRRDAMDWVFSEEVSGLFPSVDLDMIDTALTTPKKASDVQMLVSWLSNKIESLQGEIATEFYSRETRNAARRIADVKRLNIALPPGEWFHDPNYNPPPLRVNHYYTCCEDDPCILPDEEEPAPEPEPPEPEQIAAWEHPAPPEFNQLCITLLNAQIDAYTVALERTQGKTTTPFQHIISERLEAAKPKPKLSDLWQAYSKAKQVKGKWGASTSRKNQDTYNEAIAIMGDLELSQYTQDRVLDYLAALKQKGNSAATVTGKVEFISSLYKHALKTPESIEQWRVKGNPFTEMQVQDTVPVDEKKTPFTGDDIHGLLTGLLELRKLAQPHRYWVPLIALYSGMRQNEICQLRMEDIAVIDGVDVLQIRHNPALQQTTKARESRVCPVHPMLKRLGFMEYVASQRKNKQERLFSDLTYTEGKKWCGKVRGWFNETFIDKCVADTSTKSFHSFRGTFVDWFKQNKAYDTPSDRTVVQSMVGHDGDDSVTSKHYEQKFPATTQLTMLRKLDYGIDPDLIVKLKTKEY